MHLKPKGIIWKKTKTAEISRTKKRGSILPKINFPFNLNLEKRTKSRLKRRFRFLTSIGNFILRYKRTFGTACIGFLLALFFYLLSNTTYFNIKTIEFEGVDQTNIELLEGVASKYKGKNIFTLNLRELESDLDSLSVYIKGVHASKELPDKVIIRLTERYPRYTVINFDGAYLLDSESYVTDMPISRSISFSEEEWKAYYSKANTDLDIVRKRIMVDLDIEIEGEEKQPVKEPKESEEDKEIFSYDEIEEEIKIDTLNEIKNELRQTVASHFAQVDKQINESEYAGLQKIYMVGNSNLKRGETAQTKQIDFSIEVFEYFSIREEFGINRVIWTSKFSLSVELIDNRRVVFGLNKPIKEQLNDFDVSISHLKDNGKSFSRIDLSGERVKIKY